MFKKIKSLPIVLASTALMFLTEISTSTNTVFLWHEIDCPPELLKKD